MSECLSFWCIDAGLVLYVKPCRILPFVVGCQIADNEWILGLTQDQWLFIMLIILLNEILAKGSDVFNLKLNTYGKKCIPLRVGFHTKRFTDETQRHKSRSVIDSLIRHYNNQNTCVDYQYSRLDYCLGSLSTITDRVCYMWGTYSNLYS